MVSALIPFTVQVVQIQALVRDNVLCSHSASVKLRGSDRQWTSILGDEDTFLGNWVQVLSFLETLCCHRVCKKVVYQRPYKKGAGIPAVNLLLPKSDF